MQLDTSSEFGQRVQQRLEDEYVIWLTTTGSDGTPQPRPVWFIWENESFLIYTEPGAQKVKQIAGNPKVAVHFNSDSQGENIVVFIAEAQIVDNAPSPDKSPAYLDKYREGIAGLGMSLADFGQTYSVALRVTPSRLRGF